MKLTMHSTSTVSMTLMLFLNMARISCNIQSIQMHVTATNAQSLVSQTLIAHSSFDPPLELEAVELSEHEPTSQPSTVPSTQPSCEPSSQPSSPPIFQPSQKPTVQPSSQPTKQPTGQPTSEPTELTTIAPSKEHHPSLMPSIVRPPVSRSSQKPTLATSLHPTQKESLHPTQKESLHPIKPSSVQPTFHPTKLYNISTYCNINMFNKSSQNSVYRYAYFIANQTVEVITSSSATSNNFFSETTNTSFANAVKCALQGEFTPIPVKVVILKVIASPTVKSRSLIWSRGNITSTFIISYKVTYAYNNNLTGLNQTAAYSHLESALFVSIESGKLNSIFNQYCTVNCSWSSTKINVEPTLTQPVTLETVTLSPSSSPPSKSSDGKNTIASIIVGSSLGGCFCFILICCLLSRYSKSNQEESAGTPFIIFNPHKWLQFDKSKFQGDNDTAGSILPATSLLKSEETKIDFADVHISEDRFTSNKTENSRLKNNPMHSDENSKVDENWSHVSIKQPSSASSAIEIVEDRTLAKSLSRSRDTMLVPGIRATMIRLDDDTV